MKKQEQLRNPVRVKVDGKDVTRDTSVDDAYRVQKLMTQMNPESKIEIVNVEPSSNWPLFFFILV